jgi:hypothetical protein
MSEDQVKAFWYRWGLVMRCQRWAAAESEARRHEVLSALGFASIKDVGMTNDYDDLKGLLLLLSDKVLNEQEDLGFFVRKVKGGGKVETRDTAGQRRRYIHRIGEQIPELECLGYGASLKTILKTRFKVIEEVRTIFDLPTPELLNMVETLDRCIKDQREAAQACPEVVEDASEGSAGMMIAKEEGFSALAEDAHRCMERNVLHVEVNEQNPF